MISPRFWQFRGSEDLPALAAVRAAVRQVEDGVWMPGPDTVTDPAEQTPFCLLAEVDEQVVGYTWMDWWEEVDGTRLYLLLGWVVPAWRRRGVGTAMLRRQEEQAAVFAAAHTGPGVAMLGGNADEDQPGTRALLLANGYQVAFTVVWMARDLTAGPAEFTEPVLPAGIELRPVRPTHHPWIHRAIEESFAADRTGHLPRTFAEYRYDVRERQSDTTLWTVAWDGDEIAAVVINEIRPDGTGLTPWLAVRAPWRRRGIGRALMVNGLRRLSERGVASTALTTVAENPHHSMAFYRSLGYRVTRRQPRYRKPMTEAFGQVSRA